MAPYYQDEAVTLYHGDCREILPTLRADVIITDPPYPRQYLPLYGWLAQASASILPDGASVLAMAGPSYLPEILSLMGGHLRYHWTVAYTTPGAEAAQIWPRRVIAYWKPVLWFMRGNYGGQWISDVVTSQANDKRHHHWGQSVSGFRGLVQRFSQPNQIILDPFAGSGTTLRAAKDLGRRAIGIELEERHCEIAAKRLAQTVMPLDAA